MSAGKAGAQFHSPRTGPNEPRTFPSRGAGEVPEGEVRKGIPIDGEAYGHGFQVKSQIDRLWGGHDEDMLRFQALELTPKGGKGILVEVKDRLRFEMTNGGGQNRAVGMILLNVGADNPTPVLGRSPFFGETRSEDIDGIGTHGAGGPKKAQTGEEKKRAGPLPGRRGSVDEEWDPIGHGT
jgi:hypothetical protein